jgi:hypothetical protein
VDRVAYVGVKVGYGLELHRHQVLVTPGRLGRHRTAEEYVSHPADVVTGDLDPLPQLGLVYTVDVGVQQEHDVVYGHGPSLP